MSLKKRNETEGSDAFDCATVKQTQYIFLVVPIDCFN